MVYERGCMWVYVGVLHVGVLHVGVLHVGVLHVGVCGRMWSAWVGLLYDISRGYCYSRRSGQQPIRHVVILMVICLRHRVTSNYTGHLYLEYACGNTVSYINYPSILYDRRR